MIKFEKVSKYEAADFNLPVRKTKGAAGYDFEVAEDIVIPPYEDMKTGLILSFTEFDNEGRRYGTLPERPLTLQEIAQKTKYRPTLVPTGVKCQLEPGYYLELSVRSSTPLKYWLILANGVGVIDADYWNNEDNEGHIFFQLINLSPFPIQLHKGDIIGQGIIKRYEITDDDVAFGDRVGGLGSTSNDSNITDWNTTTNINEEIVEQLCKIEEEYVATPVDIEQAIDMAQASGITFEQAIANLAQVWDNLKTDIKTELL